MGAPGGRGDPRGGGGDGRGRRPHTSQDEKGRTVVVSVLPPPLPPQVTRAGAHGRHCSPRSALRWHGCHVLPSDPGSPASTRPGPRLLPLHSGRRRHKQGRPVAEGGGGSSCGPAAHHDGTRRFHTHMCRKHTRDRESSSSRPKMAASRRLMEELEEIRKRGMKNSRNIQVDEANLPT